jgi:hypothetical protein
MTALNLNLLTGFTPSTSGAYGFSVTRDQIIRQAMLDIGALQEGEVPTASEITDCAFKLNMMVKQWMGNTDFAPGLKVWTRKRADLFLGATKYLYNLGATGDNWVDSTTGLAYPQAYGQTTLTANANAGATVLAVAATSQLNILDYIGIPTGQGNDIFWTTVANIGVGTVTIPAPGLPTGGALANAYVWNYTTKAVRPLTILTAVLRDIYVNDTPLRIFRTVEEYEALPNKASPQNIADPTAILYEPQWKNQTQNGQLYLDVGGASDITKHLHCTYLAPVQDFVNPGDAPDYPQEWYRPLVLGHGKDIAGMFDCAWTQDLEDNLRESLAIARQGNPENSAVYFEVDGDGPYQ